MAIKSVRLQNTNLTLLQPPSTELTDPVTGTNYTQNKTYAVTNIIVCNNNAFNSATFDMHLVPFGDPVSNGQLGNTGTRVINQLTLVAEETFTFDTEKIILGPGDSIVFFASPSVETFTEVSGPPENPIYGDTLNLTDLTAFISYLEI